MLRSTFGHHAMAPSVESSASTLLVLVQVQGVGPPSPFFFKFLLGVTQRSSHDVDPGHSSHVADPQRMPQRTPMGCDSGRNS